jgi:hypothetical protein
MRALIERAGDVQCPPIDELHATYGRPAGSQAPAAYHGDASDMRYWLEGLRDHADEYLPPPSTIV